MTTVDLRWTPAPATSRAPGRIDDLGLTAVEDDAYIGRHRRPGMRGVAVMAMLHRPRHRAR